MPARSTKSAPRLLSSGLAGLALLVAFAPSSAMVPATAQAKAEATLALLALTTLIMARLGWARLRPAIPAPVLRHAALSHVAYKPTRAASPALCLHPVVPLYREVPVHSWLGGAPQMPTDMPWPDLDGTPALFLAQISCAHFPLALWGGRGPRDGWLLLFASHSGAGRIALRHTEKFGPERHSRDPQPFVRLHPERVDLLDRVRGGFTAPPRWPVMLNPIVSTEDLPHTRTARTAENTPEATRLLGHGDPDAPPLRPFDWTSAFLLLEAARSDLRWQSQVIAGFNDRGEDIEAQHYLDHLGAPLRQIETLRGELAQARDTGLCFNDTLGDLLLRGLAQISAPKFAANGETTQPLITLPQVRQGYSIALERYARQLYCADPRALPEPQKPLFEEHWAWHALHERGTIGGASPDAAIPAEDTVEILRLPSSALLGWAFGPGGEGTLAISITPEALETGDFSQATGKIIAP
ncbi:DUF1963 domain-containing protein [Aquicoccus sp. G2-2]|uniref:DUF1963 domain-containing protein n=1 Tax=Aquicoccus sp. G2-2 TaxID=3092120 RepID=UPI002AE01D74|nr:DUF1963 domain-containing protein [Aquicoccus sp. G2-2]MEA1114660.1 DUF1963 domain-containing protein [Aquicoccus sp. G2-2]